MRQDGQELVPHAVGALRVSAGGTFALQRLVEPMHKAVEPPSQPTERDNQREGQRQVEPPSRAQAVGTGPPRKRTAAIGIVSAAVAIPADSPAT